MKEGFPAHEEHVLGVGFHGYGESFYDRGLSAAVVAGKDRDGAVGQGVIDECADRGQRLNKRFSILRSPVRTCG